VVAADAAELRAEKKQEEEEESGANGWGGSQIENDETLEEEEDENDIGLISGKLGEEVIPDAGINWDAYTCQICGKTLSGKGATGKGLYHVSKNNLFE
jgi:hypothetical protein